MEALFARTRFSRRFRIVIGVACAITVKVVLFAPLFATLLLCRGDTRPAVRAIDWRILALAAARISVAAVMTVALLVFLHSLTIASGPTESVTDFGARVAQKTLLEIPWLSRAAYLQRYLLLQPLPWLLIALGTVAALAKRRFDLAALSLALLPIIMYRNAFPYYYVVMLAPASVLAGYAVQEISSFVQCRANAWSAVVLATLIWIGIFFQGLNGLGWLAHDGQAGQRRLIAGVHQVFPDPVNYIDRCGMIASFRKVNFFMSTWGMTTYRQRGKSFMARAIREHRPAFVLVNSSLMNPENQTDIGLLSEDYDLIARYYPEYWGPLRVAGATVPLTGTDSVRVQVPFPAEYRIESDSHLWVNGTLRQPGEVVDVPSEGVTVKAHGEAAPTGQTVRLFLASARPPPVSRPPSFQLFAGL
jgi:hypothetical protein